MLFNDCIKINCLGTVSNSRAPPRFKSWGSESGEALIEGAKRPRFEGEARIEGETRERAGVSSGEGVR